jgi:radical SAM protein with 4Fe4S-binding SPASM domain
MTQRSLPLAAEGARPRRSLPLLPDARAIDRASRPSYAVWEITLRCDLLCRHCGSRAGKAREDELNTAEALDLVDQMAAMGVEEVTLIGGEVYLRDDWPQIARRVKHHGMICGIVTGGRGFTPDVAAEAARAGIDGVGVSIDALEANHDWLRARPGSFRSALAALAALRDAGVPRAVNTQVNRRSMADVEAVLDTVAPFGIYGWQVQFTVAMGRAADDPDMLLQPYDLLELVPRLAALRARANALGIRFEPGNNVGYFGPFESAFRDKMRRGHTEPCSAGKTTLGIEANGDIKGCPSLTSADYVGGNIRDASLRDIWERSAPLRFARERTRDDLWGFCRDCFYADECLAGCTWTAHVLFGRPGNNPLCHHRALELLEIGRRERLVRVQAPPGEPFDHGRFELIDEPWPEAELEPARALVRATSPG